MYMYVLITVLIWVSFGKRKEAFGTPEDMYGRHDSGVWPQTVLDRYPGHYYVAYCDPDDDDDDALGRAKDEDAEINGDNIFTNKCWKRAKFRKSLNHDIAQRLDNMMGRKATSFPENDLYSSYVAMTYDESFLYVFALIGEPEPGAGVVTGHNGNDVPYHDNDFEMFLNPSSSNHYFIEFETNSKNATYDVLWRVTSDNKYAVPCDMNAAKVNHERIERSTNEKYARNKYALFASSQAQRFSQPTWCANTTSPFYPGTWSMYGGDDSETGMRSVSTVNGSFYSLRYPVESDSISSDYYTPWDVTGLVVRPANASLTGTNFWSVEARFPLHRGVNHGSILDTEAGADRLSLLDPNIYYEKHKGKLEEDVDVDHITMLPLYYRIDFSRTEHIMKFSPTPDGKPMPSTDRMECLKVISERNTSTLLGIDPWSCYFEWVAADTAATKYMHFPEYWSYAQFENKYAIIHDTDNRMSIDEHTPCRDITWPGRLLARELYFAQLTSIHMSKSYQQDTESLLKYCIGYKAERVNSFGFGMCEPSVIRSILDDGQGEISNWNRPDMEPIPRVRNRVADVNIVTTAKSPQNSCVDYIEQSPSGGACFNMSVTISIDSRLCDPMHSMNPVLKDMHDASPHPKEWYTVSINQDKLVDIKFHNSFCPCLRPSYEISDRSMLMTELPFK